MESSGISPEGWIKSCQDVLRGDVRLKKTLGIKTKLQSRAAALITILLWGENPTGLNRCPPTRSGSHLIRRDQEVGFGFFFSLSLFCFSPAARGVGLYACLPRRVIWFPSLRPRPHQNTELPLLPPAGSGQPGHQWDKPSSIAPLLLLKFLSAALLHHSCSRSLPAIPSPALKAEIYGRF